MTITILPVTGSPWRATRPAPPDVAIARWCPLDLHDLVKDVTGPDTAGHRDLVGWACPVCGGHWDPQGRHGTWIDGEVVAAPARLTRRQLDQALAATVVSGVVIGFGAGLGYRMRSYVGLVPEQLLWTLTAVLLAATTAAVVAVLAWNRLQAGRREVPDAQV